MNILFDLEKYEHEIDNSAFKVELHSDTISSFGKKPQRYCFILHGWDIVENLPHPLNHIFNPIINKTKQIEQIRKSLTPTFNRYGWRVVPLQYDTRVPFTIASTKLLLQLQQWQTQGAHFGDCVFLGYSTGGLVARALISQGFNARALVTLATPHTGILPYTSSAGIMPSVDAMQQGSEHLAYINNNKQDIWARKFYNCFGATYDHKNKRYDDDGLVSKISALGLSLPHNNPHFSQHFNIHRTSNSGQFPLIHNTEVLDPYYLKPFLDCCASVLIRH